MPRLVMPAGAAPPLPSWALLGTPPTRHLFALLPPLQLLCLPSFAARQGRCSAHAAMLQMIKREWCFRVDTSKWGLQVHKQLCGLKSALTWESQTLLAHLAAEEEP